MYVPRVGGKWAPEICIPSALGWGSQRSVRMVSGSGRSGRTEGWRAGKKQGLGCRAGCKEPQRWGVGSSRRPGHDKAKMLPEVKYRAKVRVRISRMLPGDGYQEQKKQGEKSAPWKGLYNTASC